MTRFLVALLAFLLLATPTLAEGTLEEAIAAYDAGDYEKAYALFLPLAEAGDAEAQYSIGFMLARGEGVPENEADGIVWLEKAVAQGHINANYYLAVLLISGVATPHDEVRAIRHLGFAAEKCHAKAAGVLGTRLFAAAQTSDEVVEAFAWFYNSIAWGSDYALEPLGAAYLYYGKELADRGKLRAKQLQNDLACPLH